MIKRVIWDLQLNTRIRDIHYNDDDFEWTTSNDKIGTFTGNMFRSSDGKTTVDGTVTCRYKDSDVQGSLKVICRYWNLQL